MLKVNAYQCPYCRDIIYSRTRHDFCTCSCGKISVDGGFDYTRVAFEELEPEPYPLEVDATKQELYDDWNERRDEFGLVHFWGDVKDE